MEKQKAEELNFNKVKNLYNAMREKERNCLRNYLKNLFKGEDRVKIVNGGKGRTNYTSQGDFKNALYDLSNWKWVEIKINKHSCVISLNMLEGDSSSGNTHALYDRIGFIISTVNEDYGILVDERRLITDIDLPLDDSKKQKIAQILQEVVIERMWRVESINIRQPPR